MVYGYILESSTGMETVGVVENAHDCCRDKFYPKPHKCSSGIYSAHFLDSSYVGPLVWQELAEAWLSTRTFSFAHCSDMLSTFLNSDRWITGRPAHHSGSRFELTINGEQHYQRHTLHVEELVEL